MCVRVCVRVPVHTCMCFMCDFGLLGVCVSRGRSVLRSIVVTSVTIMRYAGLCLFRLPCHRDGGVVEDMCYQLLLAPVDT